MSKSNKKSNTPSLSSIMHEKKKQRRKQIAVPFTPRFKNLRVSQVGYIAKLIISQGKATPEAADEAYEKTLQYLEEMAYTNEHPMAIRRINHLLRMFYCVEYIYRQFVPDMHPILTDAESAIKTWGTLKADDFPSPNEVRAILEPVREFVEMADENYRKMPIRVIRETATFSQALYLSYRQMDFWEISEVFRSALFAISCGGSTLREEAKKSGIPENIMRRGILSLLYIIADLAYQYSELDIDLPIKSITIARQPEFMKYIENDFKYLNECFENNYIVLAKLEFVFGFFIVNHESVIHRLVDLGCPTDFVKLQKQLCANLRSVYSA